MALQNIHRNTETSFLSDHRQKNEKMFRAYRRDWELFPEEFKSRMTMFRKGAGGEFADMFEGIVTNEEVIKFQELTGSQLNMRQFRSKDGRIIATIHPFYEEVQV